jgi:hypothetical protein
MVLLLTTPFLTDEEASNTETLRKERTEPAKHRLVLLNSDTDGRVVTRSSEQNVRMKDLARIGESVKGSRYKYEQVAVIH